MQKTSQMRETAAGAAMYFNKQNSALMTTAGGLAASAAFAPVLQALECTLKPRLR